MLSQPFVISSKSSEIRVIRHGYFDWLDFFEYFFCVALLSQVIYHQ